MKKESIAVVLSGIAILTSLGATCLAGYRTPQLAFDYQGIIVGILSLLITILIGWQIYNAVFWKKNIDDKIEDRLKNETGYAIKAINGLMYNAYQSNLICYLKSRDWFKIIVTQNSMIDILVNMKEKDYVEKHIEYVYSLLEHVEEFNELEMSVLKDYIKNIKKLSSFSDKIIDVCVFANTKIPNE